MNDRSQAEFGTLSALLRSIPKEMARQLERAALSSILRESRDFATALVDPDGRVFAQGECIPILNGGISQIMSALIRGGLDLRSLEPGDAILTNDPYNGGQHLQDVFLVSPVHHEGSLVALAVTTAHQADFGGGAIGQNVAAREVYDEGLILPPVPFQAERGWAKGGQIYELVRSNVRMAEDVTADLSAQFAANRLAASRLDELVRRYGLAKLSDVMAGMREYSSQRFLRSLNALPNGVYRASDLIETPRFGVDQVEIHASVTVSSSGVEVDLTGTGDQIDGYLNCPWASTVSAVESAIYMVACSGSIPFNEGCERWIKVRAPLGSIANPRPPAAVRARMASACRIFSVVVSALALAAPDTVPTSGYDTSTGVALSWFDPQNRRYRSVTESLGGGWGAGNGYKGEDAMANPLSNTALSSVEALEADHVHFRVVESRIAGSSRGDGQWSGGAGLIRTYEITRDDVKVDAFGDRHRVRPGGAAGGEPGGLGYFLLHPASGSSERLGPVASVRLSTGDRITIATGGGGGWGVSPGSDQSDQIPG